MRTVMHKYVESRTQVFQCCLDDFIRSDSSVRALDSILDYVINEKKIVSPTGQSRVGRRAFDAQYLIKLYVWGVMNGVSSCRKLEHASYVNMELRWLLKDQHPTYKTIANFRKNYGSYIASVFRNMVEVLIEDNLVTGKIWAIDGHKAKANAKRDMLSVKSLTQQVREIKASIDEIIEELDKDDVSENDSANEDTADNDGKAIEREAKVRELEAQMKLMKEKQDIIDKANERDLNYISLTDEDAMLMQTRRGKLPAHNGQIVVDSENHLIVGAEISDSVADYHSLYNVISKTVFRTGFHPKTILADAGYDATPDIQGIYQHICSGIHVNSRITDRDKQDLKFTYHSDKNVVECPQGKFMKYMGIDNKSNGMKYRRYQCKECEGCPIMDKCTKSQKGRTYKIAYNNDFLELFRNKMNQPEAKKLLSKRKAIVEHVFGTFEDWTGFRGFSLRSRVKAQIEWTLFALTYNVRRLINIMRKDTRPSKNLLGMIYQNCYYFLHAFWVFLHTTLSLLVSIRKESQVRCAKIRLTAYDYRLIHQE